jgi:hypothetical protein
VQLSKQQIGALVGIAVTTLIAVLGVFGYQVAVVMPTLRVAAAAAAAAAGGCVSGP